MVGTSNAFAAKQRATWVLAHETLSRLARERAALDEEEGRSLLAALRSAVHVHLGFGSFVEYVERLFGYKPRSTQEKLRVAEALEGLPALRRALSEGSLSWSAVRELTRVAVAENEQQWLGIACGKTLRQLEELVAGKSLGDTPAAPARPEAMRHVLRFEVAAETFATFRDAVAVLRRRSDEPLDDDSVLLAMAREVLGGPGDTGRASYQVVMSVCAECGAGRQHAHGDLVPVNDEVVAMAQCDSQQLDDMSIRAANDAHPDTSVSAHVGAHARQGVPPAMRRAVMLRDQQRCRVPGCKNAIFLDLHHIVPCAEGGRNHPNNLVALCSLHHRAVHHGRLVVEGSTADGVRFRHADGREYGRIFEPELVAAHAKTFAALRGLGFREGETRRALVELLQQNELRTASPEQLLRAALSQLTPCRAQH